jgi:hypothetical protein
MIKEKKGESKMEGNERRYKIQHDKKQEERRVKGEMSKVKENRRED